MSREQVLKWLTETGFPLEMAAASAMRQAGFEVRQSATYVDAQSEKGREIDVLARDPDLIGFIELSVVMECKSSSKPWVVLTADDVLQAYNRLRSCGVLSGDTIAALARDGKIKERKIAQYLHWSERCGYGFRQAFAKDADPGYGAAMNVVSACKGVIKELPGSSDWPTLAASIPIIVVDSPLFECQLRADGELALTEVDSSAFLFSHAPNTSCVVRVIHRDKLKATAEWAISVVNALREDLKPEQDKFFAEKSKRSDEM
jgi:hypothetical protein